MDELEVLAIQKRELVAENPKRILLCDMSDTDSGALLFCDLFEALELAVDVGEAVFVVEEDIALCCGQFELFCKPTYDCLRPLQTGFLLSWKRACVLCQTSYRL